MSAKAITVDIAIFIFIFETVLQIDITYYNNAVAEVLSLDLIRYR